MSLTCDEQNDLIREAKLLQFAYSNRNAGNFNDVTIQAGAESIPANRMVLACYSKFFESMFLSQLKERYQDTVKIREFDGQTIKSVIEYIYTGNINISENNVMALLSTADFLQVEDVKKKCFDYLQTSLTVDNCIDIVKASELYNNPSPNPKTYQFISEKFDELLVTNNFKDLSKQDLLSLITNLTQNKVRESSLYAGIISWVKHDQNREVEFSSLFLMLDLQKLPNDFVFATIVDEPLVKANKDCLNATLSYFKTKHVQEQQQDKTSKILCIGGTEHKTLIEIYNTFGKSQSKYPDLPYNLAIHCVLKLDDFVYCFGGYEDEKANAFSISEAYRLNVKSLHPKWEEIAFINEIRYDFGAATWNGKLVVTGGNDYDTFKYARLYEPRFNKWKNIAPMICGRYEHELVVANNKLFAIGGTSDSQLASVEQLDNENGKWKQMKSMNEPRTLFAAVMCNNFIYAIGGLFSWKTHKTVEKYDIDKDEWSFVRSMNVERSGHASCVLDGKIFVVGGKDGDDKAVKIMECYDPAIDKWEVMGEIERDFCSRTIIVAV